MKLSVCIPNYNYERYLARTIRSVLAQEGDIEVVVADNASTDGSVASIQQLNDDRVRAKVNACNVGFANNLDRAGRMARGDWMNMLSSDDLVRPGAFAVLARVQASLGDAAAVVTTTMDVIDADDNLTGHVGPDAELWLPAERDKTLSAVAGADVYRVDAPALLARCLRTMKNPFNFAATWYRRRDYEQLEGYGGGRLINPDKWFHWRLLSIVESALFIDAPLYAYRWHAQNQTAQQKAQGALKFLVDEYASTIELDAATLSRAGMSRSDVQEAFVERDIARHGLATLARGDRAKARRILDFGRAVYPAETRKNAKVTGLAMLLAAGGVGAEAARIAYDRFKGSAL
jgi:glycosyltransferase involved in cell wall biosynthesis